MARVFLSYATGDLAWAEEVHGWLTDDGHDVFFDRHARDGIPPGRVWKRELYAELSRVDAVVSLVTARYQASRWCLVEVSVADARGCPIIPIRGDDPDIQFPMIDELQHTSDDSATARTQVLTELRGLDGNTGWREGDNPYPGLAPFTADMSGLFFGRSAETRELASVLRATAPAKVVAVTGPSGSGKSSLLRAGLLPHLTRDWITVGPFTLENAPTYALAKALSATANHVGLNWSIEDTERRLATTDGLRRAADEIATRGRHVLIAIDQGEDLFAEAVTDDRRSAFAALIEAALAGATRVVMTVRSEFDAELSLLGRVVPFRVGPLDRHMVRAAIEGPARIAGLKLPPGLTDRLIEDTGTGDALPLLAFALNKLADGLPRGGTLSLADYEATGLRKILADHAEAAMAAACAGSGLTEEEVTAALVRGMVSEDATGRRTRRALTGDTLDKPLRAAIGEFVTRRLVISDGHHLRLAHDALIAEWPDLAAAVETRGAALRAAALVGQAATDWDNAARADGYLWDARRYHAVIDDLGGPRRADWKVEVDSLGPDFLTATQAAITHSARKRRRRLAGVFTGLSVLLAVSLVSTVIALNQTANVQRERDTALVRQLIARADAVRVTDPPLALRLGLAAEAIQPGPPSAVGLTRTLIVNKYAATITAHDEPVFVTRFNPRGTLLASGDAYDNKILLHDVRDPRDPVQIGAPLTGHTHWVSGIAFTPDGDTMISSSTNETILWDLTDPGRPRERHRMTAPDQYAVDAVGVAVSPDGELLATMHGTHLALHGIRNRDRPVTIVPRLAAIVDYGDVAFSADGRYLAAGTNRGSYRVSESVRGRTEVWRVSEPATPVKVADLGVTAGDVTGVAFSPGGHRLAVTSGGLLGDAGGELAVYEVTDTGATPTGPAIADHAGGAWDVEFHPSGSSLATTGLDGVARTYFLDTIAVPVGDPLADHRDFVYAVDFGPQGQMATGGADGTVIIWGGENPYLPSSAASVTARERVTEIAVDPTGTVLAAGDAKGGLSAWDVTERHVPRGPGTLPGDGHAVTALAFRPGSKVVVSATGAHDAVPGAHGFYDLTAPAGPRLIARKPSPQRGDAIAVWLSPDGHRMRVVDTNASITEWDTTDPATASPGRTGLADREDAITEAAIRPDGRMFASKGKLDTSIAALRDITDLAEVRLLDGALRDYRGGPITFSAHGGLIATGGNTVLLWDVTTPSAPRRFGVPFGDANTGLAISPDNTLLAVAGRSGRLQVWNITDPGTPFLVTALDHPYPVAAMAWFPDSAALASAESSGKIRLWSTAALVGVQADRHAAACARARGGLTEDEWDRFVGASHGYRQTCP